MFDTAVWGSGDTEQGRFKANKAISSANIETVPGGILVDWGNGDSVTIPGSAYTLQTINCPVSIGTRYVSSFSYAGKTFSFWATGSDAKYIYPATYPCKNRILIRYDGSSNPWRVDHFVWGWASAQKVGNPSWIFSSLRSSVANAYRSPCAFNSVTSPFGSLSSPGCGGAGVASGDYLNLVGNQFVSSQSSQTFQIKRVTSDLQISTERVTTQNPAISVLTAGCKIVITHEDSEVVEIPLDYCPLWTDLVDSQACPAGSCECIHDGHKCCYDNSTGELIKVVSL